MSFICKACGRQRAGSPALGEMVAIGVAICDDCRATQLGRAVLALANFKEIGEPSIRALDAILDEAQNDPPDGAADGSIPELRWITLRRLVAAARAYNDALKRAQ
jgi:hypothetical protein